MTAFNRLPGRSLPAPEARPAPGTFAASTEMFNARIAAQFERTDAGAAATFAQVNDRENVRRRYGVNLRAKTAGSS